MSTGVGVGAGLPYCGQIAFSPKAYSGLKAWYKADLHVSLDVGDPTIVTGMGDQSGNSLTISQGTTANQPHLLNPDSSLNGKRSVDYDGGDYLASSSNLDLSSAYTIIIVVKIDTIGASFANGFLRIASGIVTGGNGFCVYGENSGGKLYVGDVQGSAFYQGFNGHYATGAYVFTFRCDGTAGGRAVRKNGSVLTPTVNVGAGLFVMPSANKLFVGAGWNHAASRLDGKIPEVLCYNVALTDAQCNKLEKYCGSYFGITVA
jgi:hypothetical protein